MSVVLASNFFPEFFRSGFFFYGKSLVLDDVTFFGLADLKESAISVFGGDCEPLILF